MKKYLIMILLALIAVGCSKKTTEIEISENINKSEINDEQVKATVINEEKSKPLIKISNKDVLEIYVRADGAPGMYLDTDGEVKGFYVELEKSVMKEMNQEYRMNSYTDAGVAVQMIRDGVAHSALSVPLLADYKTFLNISIPFEVLNYVTIVQEDNNEIPINATKDEILKLLEGKKVGVQTRGHIYQFLRDYKEIIMVEYPTTTQAEDALNNGELDAVIEVKRIMEHYSKTRNWKLKAVGEPVLFYDIGTGFSQALDPSVVDRYNVALKTLIDNGYVTKLYKQYFGE